MGCLISVSLTSISEGFRAPDSKSRPRTVNPTPSQLPHATNLLLKYDKNMNYPNEISRRSLVIVAMIFAIVA